LVGIFERNSAWDATANTRRASVVPNDSSWPLSTHNVLATHAGRLFYSDTQWDQFVDRICGVGVA